MNEKEQLFRFGVTIVLGDLEKKANSKYGVSPYKVWNTIGKIIEQGTAMNIPGYGGGGNAFGALIEQMQAAQAPVGQNLTKAEQLSQ